MSDGAVVWLTGLPASGKTTLAWQLQGHLAPVRPVVVLDGDELRPHLAPDLGYGARARDEFYRRLAELAALLARQGLAVVVAATAPHRSHRDRARRLAPRFLEVHVATTLDRCAARDPKGLYARACAGAITDLPGVGERYEPPEGPEIVATDGDDPDVLEAVARWLRTGPLVAPVDVAPREAADRPLRP